MPDYRLYFHGKDGHFIRAENIDVADDALALAMASSRKHRYIIEVWSGKRMVGIVEPEP